MGAPATRNDEPPPPPPPARLLVPGRPSPATVTVKTVPGVYVNVPDEKPAPAPAFPGQPPAPPPPHALTVSVRQPAGIVKVAAPTVLNACFPGVQTEQTPPPQR